MTNKELAQDLCGLMNHCVAAVFPSVKHIGNGVEIITDQETIDQCIFDFTVIEGDIVVGYDYVEDELTPSEKDRLSDMLNDLWVKFTKCGFEQVHDNDGSGNGLVYGVIVWRKV